MRNNFYINDVQSSTQIDRLTKSGNVEVTACIAGEMEGNIFANETRYYLNAWITGGEGLEADRIFPLPIEKKMQFCMCVKNPVLWNAEQADTYDLNLEICTEEGEVIDRSIGKIAFWRWEILDGKTCLNKKEVEFRTAVLPAGLTDPERLKKFLRDMKRNYKNTLLVRNAESSEELESYCIQYGIYYIAEGEHLESARLMAKQEETQGQMINPDFALQVVQNGVLIENKCIFSNASDYDLCYEVIDESGEKQSGKMIADVPAKTSRFIEVPFELPEKPGEYIYHVSLCLKEDKIWGEAGYSIAEAQTRISNFFGR